MTDWRKPYDYPMPDPKANVAEYMLAYKVHTDLQNTAFYFLPAQPEDGYIDPQNYLESMIGYAISLTTNPYMRYAPADWKPIPAAFKYAASCMDWLKNLAVNAGDPDTWSVYDAWVNHTGQMYGGHPPGVSSPAPATGGTAATGQGAAPPGSIL